MKDLKDKLINEASANLCTFYGYKFPRKELSEFFKNFGEEIIKSKLNIDEIAISAYKNHDNKLEINIKAKDARYNEFFNETLEAKYNKD